MSDKEGYTYILGPDHSKAYCRGRPTYPSFMMDIIKSYMQENNKTEFTRAVEVGCGNGQATVLLSSHFQEVIATDFSELQIAETKSLTFPENISFLVSPAEAIPVDSDSADLVLAAQAAHFFDLEKFYSETDRVLKSGGCLSLIGFGHLKIQHPDRRKELDELINNFKTEKIKKNLGIPMAMFESLYADVVLPYPSIRKDFEFSDPNMTVARFIQHVRGWRTYQKALNDNPNIEEDLVIFQDRIMEILGVNTTPEETVICTVAPGFVIIGRKP